MGLQFLGCNPGFPTCRHHEPLVGNSTCDPQLYNPEPSLPVLNCVPTSYLDMLGPSPLKGGENVGQEPAEEKADGVGMRVIQYQAYNSLLLAEPSAQ